VIISRFIIAAIRTYRALPTTFDVVVKIGLLGAACPQISKFAPQLIISEDRGEKRHRGHGIDDPSTAESRLK
jgi:hypothetical protein